MAGTSLQIARLQSDFPAIQFEKAEKFRWSPKEATVYCGPLETPRDEATLLHELGHALCGHSDFTHDIDLIKMEREAWTKATAISAVYAVTINDEMIEDALDTYRDWLDARSRCPNCNQTGVQESDDVYHCVICLVGWRVNDARQCGLKRYTLSVD